ncbi:MAG: hypothetical protein H7Y32_04420, partial [Chloroflexales bacterium]|nr:hypothetical protein [Chloroflexales bacterium]
IYGAVALCGLLAAAAVLRAGWPAHGASQPWPWGMFIGGLGVTTMLAAAPFDDLWHRLYGIDVTIWSPPHMLGVAGAWMIALGALLMWAARWRTTENTIAARWSLVGFAVSGALLVSHTNFGLIPAVRWSFTQPHTPFLYPLLASLVLPAVMVIAVRLSGRWWAPLAVLLAVVAIRLVEQAVLEVGYRYVITGWGERLRDEPGPIYRNYNIGVALAAVLCTGSSLAAYALDRKHAARGWRGGVLLGAAAGLSLWLGTALIHTTWHTAYNGGNISVWREEAGAIVGAFGGAHPGTVLLAALAFGAVSGMAAGGIINRRGVERLV